MTEIRLPDPRQIERDAVSDYVRQGPPERYAWQQTPYRPYRTLTDEQVDRWWVLIERAWPSLRHEPH